MDWFSPKVPACSEVRLYSMYLKHQKPRKSNDLKQHRNHHSCTSFSTSDPSLDVALSSSLLCHDPHSPTQGCCSDGGVLLGGFGGPLNTHLTVSSVEYLGPEEEHPPPGGSILFAVLSHQLVNGHDWATEATGNRKNGFVNWVGVFFFCRIMVDQYKSVWDCCDQFDEILETTWIKREGLFFMLLSLTKKTCCWVIIWWINCDFIIFTKLWIRCCWHICVWIEPPQMNHWRAAKTFQWHCLLPLCKRATSRSCLHQSCQL